MRTLLLTAAGLAAFAAPAQAQVSIQVEPAATQSTSVVSPAFVEDFSTRGPGTQNGTGTPNLDTFTSNFGGSPVTGTFTGFELGLPNSYGGNGFLYGGAFGSTNYGVVHGNASIKLDRGVKYFGLWAAALDGNNTIELFSAGDSLGFFNLVSSISPLGQGYFGNPNLGGANGHEPYAFVNFLSDRAFDEIRFYQSGGGFEFDNVTVGAAVPEPATWALMIGGFGLIGGALRRRKRTLAFA